MSFRSLVYTGMIFLIFSVSCSTKKEKFRLVPSSESGITFRNVLTETPEFNILNYLYFYNGGGVAVGDVNGDSLVDIYFTANQTSNKLYLNTGNFKFKDVTEISSVEGFDGWATGVTMADVNSDGKLDLYVSYVGDYLIYKGKNQLFINEGNDENGIPKFKDRAIEYGLDLIGFSTQASFFDYDRDGDLDMFMLTHSVHQNGTYGKATMRQGKHPLAGDRLLRNDNGRFVDVTDGSGISNSVIGYGLGVVVSDVNMDGWMDVYVGNDFHENDYLYLNNRNGTFTESLEHQMQHTSRYTMGVDFADFNNDLYPDLIAADMLSEDPHIHKSAMAEDTYDVFQFKIGFGYNHQFSRNTLQINNANGTFSEIALAAGVSATDWSWSALFADFDLDGKKDIFISNGIHRRFNDLDYINFASADTVRMKVEGGPLTDKEMVYIQKMPKVKVPNYLFVNNGDSTFVNQSSNWGLDLPSYSQGTAYADLDNDGDLDLVVNNIEDEAFVYENRTLDKDIESASTNHFLQISLNGKEGNKQGIGSKVIIYSGVDKQMQECISTRGFLSAVDVRLTFGLDSIATVDSLLVIWPDGTFQKLQNLKVDSRLTLNQSDAAGEFDYSRFHTTKGVFKSSTSDLNLKYKHKENDFVEFLREPLIPHMMSAEGPAAAVGDVNGDGLEDLFLGGAKWKEGKLFIQTSEGKFNESRQQAIANDSIHEDVDAVFFDADQDKDLDLFIVSGGNEFFGKSENCKPRLYINDGKGSFSRSGGIPDIYLTGSCVSVNDIDLDGDLDLFVGARAVPWHYGIPASSYILMNDGKGNFADQTSSVAPQLQNFGFVKHAVWADVNNDKRNDLIIAAEWSPITILLNQQNKLKLLPLEGSGLENSNGWWNYIYPIDVDNDQDLDFIAGNLGLNSKLKATIDQPVRMYVSDFDKNDSTDQLLTYYYKGVEYPFHTRDEIMKQMPSLKKKFLSYHSFSEASFKDLFKKELLDEATVFEAKNFKTSLVINKGDVKFELKPLPDPVQWSIVNASVSGDFNLDDKPDLLLAGNFFPVNVQRGRYDASYGWLLTNDGAGNFHCNTPAQSGLRLTGEVRKLLPITIAGVKHYLAIRNNNTIESIMLEK